MHIPSRYEQNKNNRIKFFDGAQIQDADYFGISPARNCVRGTAGWERPGAGIWMLSVIIATHDSERALVATLAALVPGATAGVVREVIVADGGSRDETEQVADIAGCRFFASDQALGARLKAAAATARGEWLMFLRPGIVPGPSWIDETIAFGQSPAHHVQAAVFASEHGFFAALRLKIFLPAPEQGLILRKSFYDELGGHRADAADPEADLLRRIGPARLTTLRTAVTRSNI
jgi:glycosyltransferase involved in cell wall biosynthesis